MVRMLENERIKLRAPEPEDLDAMFILENDANVWQVSGNCAPYSRYQLMKYIENSAHDFLTDHQIRFSIQMLTDGTVSGFIDLTNIDAMESRAHVGIGVLSGFRGQGIGSDALMLIMPYARDVLMLHQLYAFVPVTNMASRNMLSRCGFSDSGIMKDWTRTGTGYTDAVFMQVML